MTWTLPSRVLIQGTTEPLAIDTIDRIKAYGTEIIAAIEAGLGGQHFSDIPIFDLVEEAIEQMGEITTTLIFVSADRVLDAALEAIAANIKQIIIITSGVPPLDTVKLLRKAQATNTLILGPGSGGIIVPQKILLGTIEPEFYTPGNIALISCCNSLSYEVALELNKAGLGQSFAVTIGNELINGSSFGHWLQILSTDSNTEAIVLVDRLGGGTEEVTKYINNQALTKPVIAYIAGLESPLERPFKDAATIIANQLSYSVPAINNDKQIIAAIQKAKINLAKRPSQIPESIAKVLKK